MLKVIARNLQLVTRNVAAERERLILWFPVPMMLGAGVYFALPQEPPILASIAALGISTLGLWFAVSSFCGERVQASIPPMS